MIRHVHHTDVCVGVGVGVCVCACCGLPNVRTGPKHDLTDLSLMHGADIKIMHCTISLTFGPQ